MELKKYQKTVINDLNHFLSLINEKNDIIEAYNTFWTEKDVRIGENGVKKYKDTINGVPHICFKVPTGGGKTFLACASIKPIFSAMPEIKSKVVVWLVPSNAILEQTIKNLNNPDHPYRQKISSNFGGRVEVYTKEQLLNAQNFNPTSVREQLSVCILSFDSLRSNKKDGRKLYQQNSCLAPFAKQYTNRDTLIDDVDDTALMQVLNQFSPVVIVDESHNAQSDLSVEMLNNLNPSFVLDLTATPKDNSNIICFVDAAELKKENMVKLPVIVYNRTDKENVMLDAIDLQKRLEIQAMEEEKTSGRYIRPIVLFQAQTKAKENNEDFKQLKNRLVNIGIPENQIAIKTADVNELKNVDLMSRDCEIRYIITVNALKEGWDCPFAYVLATIANKTSAVDVEQILGRILRQPNAQKCSNSFMNLSYVLTCSNDFFATLDKIVKGLNNSGFSSNDYKTPVAQDLPLIEIPSNHSEQIEISNSSTSSTENESIPEFLDFNDDILKNAFEERMHTINASDNNKPVHTFVDEILHTATEINNTYEQELNKTTAFNVPTELRPMMNTYEINSEFKDEIMELKLPQFFCKGEADLFEQTPDVLLTKDSLAGGFTLKGKSTEINFDTANENVYQVDISASKSGCVPKYKSVTKKETEAFKEYFFSQTSEVQLKILKNTIFQQLEKIDFVDARDVHTYIDRVVEDMSANDRTNLETSATRYGMIIKKKIEQMIDNYREEQFKKMLDTGELFCEETYTFPTEITPQDKIDSIEKSLYQAEYTMNGLEREIILKISSEDNVKWWHRVPEKKGYYINGFINHYPDFIIKTHSGMIIFVETKGEHLANDDSRQKVYLGRQLCNKAGDKYRYFMVFKDKALETNGAYSIEHFMEILKKL